MAFFHGWDLREALRLTLVASRREAEPRSLFELAEAAFKGGVTALQLREKTASDLEVFELAKSLAPFCRERGKLFLIDDRLDVALAADADGVHLGQADLPAEAARAILPKSKIVGISASNLPQAEQALAAGADYLGLGAIIPTDSKTDASVISQADIRAVNSLGAITVAIGGITLDNAKAIRAMGFQGLAVISALTKAPDPEAAARRLLEGA
ncbi:MAG: thiamine phosphate synthase [Deltaproteobacteria bacterium]|jgi:thiamine-phosphate pyrophosphorylase|nr:thiamine phosphate synthase [Deltaproteobacteria bacterium]